MFAAPSVEFAGTAGFGTAPIPMVGRTEMTTATTVHAKCRRGILRHPNSSSRQCQNCKGPALTLAHPAWGTSVV